MTTNTKFKAFDPTKDYTKELTAEELKHEGKRTFVYLRGLERLAKERGVQSALTTRAEQLGSNGVLVSYQYKFWDGSVYEGSADATVKNCDGNFKLYLTAMAESRAKARALRTAFGVTLCSVEEKSDMQVANDDDFGPISDHQLVAIKSIAKTKGLSASDILQMMEVPKKKLESLTKEEGTDLIKMLNEFKKPKLVKKKA